ncbi:MAG: glycosyltransferase [Flavobacteriales bacterium]|nr:glycosyltransferase [Flavobacteriales bacterium]
MTHYLNRENLGHLGYFLFFVFIVGIALLVKGDYSNFFILFILLFQIIYFLMTYYKGFLFVISIFHKWKQQDNKFNLIYYPTFNILLPNYKEKKETIEELIHNINQLNYPKEYVKAFLIAQKDDNQTINAIGQIDLPAFVELLIIPSVQPGETQSKSRALNYALKQCTADYITIFDSEDAPDPDQFLKVAQRFAESDVDVIQCTIGIYNTNQNFISRFFAAEFRCFFQYLLRGISVLGTSRLSPYLPLGGTSFYVRRNMMEQIGEFDMFNPTEDLIFSSSVYRKGGKIEHLESVTFGEAPVKYKQLINQRTRWVKGFMISTMVLNQNVFKTWREIGFLKWLTFNLWTIGSVFGLTAPILIVFTLSWLLIDTNIYGEFIPEWLWLIGYGGLFIGGTLISIVIFAIPAISKGRFLDALLTPFFIIFSNFILMISAYKALYQLIFNPSMGWVKTEHGLAQKDIEIEAA